MTHLFAFQVYHDGRTNGMFLPRMNFADDSQLTTRPLEPTSSIEQLLLSKIVQESQRKTLVLEMLVLQRRLRERNHPDAS